MHNPCFLPIALLTLACALPGCGGSGDEGKVAAKPNPGDSGGPAVVGNDTPATGKGSPDEVEPGPDSKPPVVPPEPSPAGDSPRSAASAGGVDPDLPDYIPVPGISGSLKAVGSDTMFNLMSRWSEGFKKHYPNVREEIEGKGSSTAMPALIEGTATFGPMSRAAKPDEIDKFEKKFGYKPTQLGTSIDMLALFVNRDNPIEGLSLAQCDAIFSRTRRLGATDDVTTWGQLGLAGAFADQPISLYGRNSASGTYGYFKEAALGDGDYKASVKEQPGSSAVVRAIGREKYAIGYSGIGYRTEDVRALPLSAKAGDTNFVAPAAANFEEYPLSRFLYVTLDHERNSELPPLQREFLKYVYSRQGQEDVLQEGYVPVPAAVAKQELARVGIE